jgi:bifunctional UDP-N-acetylglucosamine pyrophosphorylase/glucosamine-1-phosphate N-acetyltransferase
VYEGRWAALKYPWHLLDVMEMLFERWASGAESPGPDYTEKDGVWYGRDVKVYNGGFAAAPALLDHGAVIGNNALVRSSIVGPNSVVGFGSEVARSYLGAHVELHHNYVGDSVFGNNSSMGWGATTANFRLDGRTVPSRVRQERVDSGRMKLGLMLGEGAKIGVNTSLMPGVKIGAGAIVGANLRVSRDIPDGARLLDERSYGRF